MSKEFLQRAITFALQNRVDNSEKAKALAEFNAKVDDWYTTCPKCQAHLRGTIAQLKEHKCG